MSKSKGRRRNGRQKTRGFPTAKRMGIWKKAVVGATAVAAIGGLGGLAYWAFSKPNEIYSPPAQQAASDLPRIPSQEELEGFRLYMEDFSPKMKPRLNKDGFTLVNLEKREHFTMQQLDEIKDIMLKSIPEKEQDDLVRLLGPKWGLNIKHVADSLFVNPASDLEEEVIRGYVKDSITDFNHYISELPLRRYVPDVGFPKTPGELRAMHFPNVYYVGASLEAYTVWGDLESKQNGKKNRRRLDVFSDSQVGGGDARRHVVGDPQKPESLRIGFAPHLVHTASSRFDYNTFDPSPVFEYFHGIVSNATALNYSKRAKILYEGRERVAMDELQAAIDECSREEEIFVHALGSVWLEDYFKRKNNMGLTEEKVKACFSNLDEPRYQGTRQLMPRVRRLGPKETHRLYRDNSKELFRGIK